MFKAFSLPVLSIFAKEGRSLRKWVTFFLEKISSILL